jgi:hypothetical protein
MPRLAAVQPPQRPLHAVAGGGEGGLAWNHMVERHGDISTELPLNLGRALGSKGAERPVDVALKLDTVLLDPPQSLE